MLRIFSIFAINIFVALSLAIRFIGINNCGINYGYFQYKKIAQNAFASDIKAIVVIPEKKIRTIKIFRMPIGAYNGLAVDTEGNLFKTKIDSLITVEGVYQKWPEYYKKLQQLELIDAIYHVRIYDYRIDVWMRPGVLIQLDSCVENLKEFYTNFPQFFQKGKLIDLRCTNRIGISDIA